MNLLSYLASALSAFSGGQVQEIKRDFISNQLFLTRGKSEIIKTPNPCTFSTIINFHPGMARKHGSNYTEQLTKAEGQTNPLWQRKTSMIKLCPIVIELNSANDREAGLCSGYHTTCLPRSLLNHLVEILIIFFPYFSFRIVAKTRPRLTAVLMLLKCITVQSLLIRKKQPC